MKHTKNNMAKIIWMIQQSERAGGTEMVSFNLLSALKKYYDYDILLVSVGEKPQQSFLDLKDCQVRYLNVPMQVVRFDEYFARYLHHHQFIKLVVLCLKLLYHFILKKSSYRRKMYDLSNEDDIIIASSMDSYLFAPLRRKVIFHYHFDGEDYLNLGFRLMMKFARKPDFTVFLTQCTLNQVLQQNPELKSKSNYIYNPSRFDSIFIPSHEKLRLIFVGRLEKQKNPELLIEVMRILKQRKFAYHLDICGDGSKFPKIQAMINDYQLSDVITMHGMVNNIDYYYRNADGQIVTSFTEGYALSIIEANCFSLFSISTLCGESIYEVINQGVNGIVVESFDADLIADTIINTFKNDCTDLKKQAYQHSKQYAIATVIEKWHQLFIELGFKV